jgi:hypothetical protein
MPSTPTTSYHLDDLINKLAEAKKQKSELPKKETDDILVYRLCLETVMQKVGENPFPHGLKAKLAVQHPRATIYYMVKNGECHGYLTLRKVTMRRVQDSYTSLKFRPRLRENFCRDFRRPYEFTFASYYNETDVIGSVNVYFSHYLFDHLKRAFKLRSKKVVCQS